VSAAPLQGLTVLVIDDHCDTVEMFVEYLRLEGAIVLGVRSAPAALTHAAGTRFDAVLVDLLMPGEDGRWFLRALRSSGTPSAKAPVFAVSGGDAGAPGEADGFAGFFLKPANLETLVAKLRALPRQVSQAPTI
jgi:CheY-like chemotaxis protein